MNEHCGNVRVEHDKFELTIRIDSVPEAYRLTKDISDNYKRWYVTRKLTRAEFLAYRIVKAMGPLTEQDVSDLSKVFDLIRDLMERGLIKHTNNQWEATL